MLVGGWESGDGQLRQSSLHGDSDLPAADFAAERGWAFLAPLLESEPLRIWRTQQWRSENLAWRFTVRGRSPAHVASWLKTSRAEIVSVSSRRLESAKNLAAEFQLDCAVTDDYQAVLRDKRVDVVNISGPNHVHAEQAIAAAKAGKHLMIEKPMCITAEENRALRDAVAAVPRVKSVVSFVPAGIRCSTTSSRCWRRGRSATCSTSKSTTGTGSAPYSGWQWAHTRQTGGSTMLLAGCHAADAIRYFAGCEVVEVAAFGNNIKRLRVRGQRGGDPQVRKWNDRQDVGPARRRHALLFQHRLVGTETPATTASGRSVSFRARPGGRR